MTQVSRRERLEAMALKGLAENSYYEFVKQAFKVIEPSTPFVDNFHVQYLCNVMQAEVERIAMRKPKTKDIVINIPPRSLKSFIATVCLAPWAWIRYPSMKLISSSYSGPISLDLSLKSRRIIESPWYQERWGHLVQLQADQNQKSYFENTGMGSRTAVSTGGSVTGKGADIVMIDDPQNPEEANSDVQRMEAIDHFTNTLSSRLNDPVTGIFIVIMQRLHEADLTGYLLDREKERWRHICLPVTDSPRVQPEKLRAYYRDGLMFPARFSSNFIEQMKQRMGTIEYAGQYDQSPRKQEGNIIKEHWFKRYHHSDLPAQYQVDFYCDTAYTDKKDNDPSVIFSYTRHNGSLYILHISRKWMEFPDFCRHLIEYAATMGASPNSRIYVEPKASGKSVVQQLKRLEGLNIVEDEPPTQSKVERAHVASPRLEAGKVFLPHLDDKKLGGAWIEEFLEECKNFPNALHDDQVDCLTGAIRKGLKASAWAHI